MVTRRQFTLGLPSTAFVAAIPAALRAASERPSRRGEVQLLRRFAEQTHPRGLEAASQSSWRDRWAALETAADGLSDGAYFIRVRRALGWFDDGHTTVLPFEFADGLPEQMRAGPFGRNLPVQARAFHDGLFVTASSASNRQMLGARIGSIGTLSAEELIRVHATDWPGNSAWAHRWAGLPFGSSALLEGFGAIRDAAAPVTFGMAGSMTMNVAPIAGAFTDRLPINRTTSGREGWAREATSGNYVRLLPERRAIYLSIDEMGDTGTKSFEQLTRDLFAALETPQAERLVMDLRRNGGGNNYFGEPLRKRIQASRFNRPGALYLLIGPRTFSAAQNLANRLERESFALFVGEPTGGAPNHYGDAKVFKGETTGLTAMVSTLPWFDSYPHDKRPWIMPDLLVPDLFEDWRSGRDAALETALAHRPTGAAADELSRERIFYFERESQKQTWNPFWRA